ncbi:MAG: TlpA family protein disulfide reductase [Chloroflexi bacterium]|nr:TlpA family protein disulfide reductase [Chloroflexota bacterium]
MNNTRSLYRRFFALSMIGLGLLAIAVAFFLLTDTPTSASNSDFSTVPAEVNYPAPELNLITLDGEPASLLDFRGQVVLVNLWATWCPPCRDEMPTLQEFYDEYRSEGFVLIAIDQGETSQQVIPFVNEFNLTFPIWLDPNSEAGAAFKSMNLPSSYVIDRNGRVRLMWIGGISKKILEKYVPGIIKER